MTVSRLAAYVPGGLDADQQAVYDQIVSGPRASGPQDFPLRNADGSLTGPFNALVAGGRLGAAVQAVGAALRYEGSLSAPERELVILVVGRHWNAEFEFYAHARVARRLGVDDVVIDAVAAGDRPPLAVGRQDTVYDVVVELLGTGRVSDATYERAAEVLGERLLVELVVLVGYYTMLAQLLNAFEVGVPDGEPAPFGAATAPT